MLPKSITSRLPTLLLLLLLILIPLAVFTKTAQEVWEEGGFGFDAPTLLFIHRAATPTLDRVMVFITTVAGFYSLPFITLAVCALFWFRRHRRWAVFLLLAVAGSGALMLTIKTLFRRVRPHLWLSPAPETDYGFPSGHSITSISFFLALVLLAWPTRYRWPALILGTIGTLLVGFSRLYLGVHYPSDVIAAWAVGLLWTAVAFRVLFRHHPLKQPEGFRDAERH
ncbi:MAG: phosphatase PAP2 family protein [Deinococcus sp.]